MFDVILIAKKDSDLYEPLCKTAGCSGYFQVRMQDDPKGETMLLKHVIDGSNPVGRKAVLEHLRTQWGFPLPGLGDVGLGADDASSSLGWLVAIGVAGYIGFKLGESVVKNAWAGYRDTIDEACESGASKTWTQRYGLDSW